MENNANSDSNVHYKPPFTFGLGGVPLGNEFAVVTDKDAYAILDAAWSAGIRYYDVSPWYGLGLAERRYGNFLHNKNRSEYIISSKVGKLLKASKTAKNRELFPFSPSPNDVIFDYTASGVRRSFREMSGFVELWLPATLTLCHLQEAASQDSLLIYRPLP